MKQLDPETFLKISEAVKRLARTYCEGLDPSWCNPDEAAESALIRLWHAIEREPKLAQLATQPAWITSFCGKAIHWYLMRRLAQKANSPKQIHDLSLDDVINPTHNPGDNLVDIDALTIVFKVREAATPQGKQFIDSLIAGASTRSELARDLQIQSRTLGKWLMGELPLLRNAIESVLARHHGTESRKVLGDAIHHVSTIINDPEWFLKGGNMELQEIRIALKKMKIRLGNQRYQEAKASVGQTTKEILSLMEAGLRAGEILDYLSVKFTPENDAARKAAKMVFLKAIPEIRLMIEQVMRSDPK